MELILQRKMYYDKYEKDFGDGFYPQLFPLANIDQHKQTSVIISFKLTSYNDELVWCQHSGSVIYGFDGVYGVQLLLSLNTEAKSNAKKILNFGARIIFPKTLNSTFRVLLS